MLPVKIDGVDPRRGRATLVLAVMCIVAFFWSQGQTATVISSLWFDPREFSWSSWLTSAFLHADVFHLAGNLVFLAVFGACVEQCVGWWRFLLLFVACELGAVAAYAADAWIESSLRPAVGASGAISGIMGFALVVVPRARMCFLWRYDADGHLPRASVWGYVALWLVWQLPSIVAAPYVGVAWAAHIGGLVCGVVLALWALSERTAGTCWHVERPGFELSPDEHPRLSALDGYYEATRYRRASQDD